MTRKRADAAAGPSGAGHVPLRMCCVCRVRLPKKELQRFVAAVSEGIADGPLPDPSQTMPGRGFYVCHRPECMEKFRRHGVRRKQKGNRA